MNGVDGAPADVGRGARELSSRPQSAASARRGAACVGSMSCTRACGISMTSWRSAERTERSAEGGTTVKNARFGSVDFERRYQTQTPH